MENGNQEMIRQASMVAASRIAKILIFAKRTHYRAIFQNDMVSFDEMRKNHPIKLFEEWKIPLGDFSKFFQKKHHPDKKFAGKEASL